MEKIIVQPTGSWMYLDPESGGVIHPTRPTVIGRSFFIEERLGEGNLKLLTQNLPEKANDADFYQVYVDCEGNAEQAVAAYASEFGLDEFGNKLQIEETKPVKVAEAKAEAKQTPKK